MDISTNISLPSVSNADQPRPPPVKGGQKETVDLQNQVPAGRSDMPLDERKIAEKAEEMNNSDFIKSKNLRFAIDEDSGATVVKIVDSKTDVVIKQIPSEEMLKISQAIDDMLNGTAASGVLIKQKA